MRIGILWSDGDIVTYASLEEALQTFLNGKILQREFPIRPRSIVSFDGEDWGTLVPTEEQVRVAMSVIDMWYQSRKGLVMT